MTTLAATLRATARHSTIALLTLLVGSSLLTAQQGQDGRTPALPPGAEILQVPAGHHLSFHAFAMGFQIYKWDAATNRWIFVAPAALLFADAGCHQPIGSHFAGPTWVSNSGSTVVGRVLASSIVDPTAIPWLLLAATSAQGPGPFSGTTYIQRVNTVGGRAPARNGAPNETVWIPYTAEYFYYRAH